ncbi:AAA family ATPase [Oricola indica]|uniref:AAA family ATPase n=1 Tax=Oricola indica TaxID=2872591 RepID=UPI001CBEEFCA|nr:AAA family ATPase [Oricola indica]
MPNTPIDDIEEWSTKLSPWKRDALRRLATTNKLTQADFDDLMAMVKSAAGFELTAPAPTPVPFAKSHFSGEEKRQNIVLKGIANVENVNRLTPKASVNFGPNSLTVIYGRNGSGKSGFVRILRTACRTRVENVAKLKVLSDVYGGSSGPQTAEILIDAGSGETPVQWTSGSTALPELTQVAVFDTASAELYVDGGNQIRYLPFGLALPHQLNTVCMELKEKLDEERAKVIGDKVGLSSVSFPSQRDTKSQLFERSVNKSTTDDQIVAATTFTAENEKRLGDLTAALSAGTSAAADVNALVNWTSALQAECAKIDAEFGDAALETSKRLREEADAARQAAKVAADALFTDEPLPGVGGETWRALWAAARNYSLSEAYPESEFPVLGNGDEPAACVLCQQPLAEDGRARLQRFQKYMDDTLDATAEKLEVSVTAAAENLMQLACLGAEDFSDRVEQVRKRSDQLADSLSALRTAALKRRDAKLALLNGQQVDGLPDLVIPLEGISAFENEVKAEQTALTQAANSEEREKLSAEKDELEDRKIIAANREKLTTRRNLLLMDAAFEKALSDLQTRGITQRANELVDSHLTKAVTSHFDGERETFDIMHLKVGLARKSNQTKAEFQVDPQTKLTKVTSEILSEGEQRALALAGFLTEVALTDGSGPVVIDDPVSSLDRDRSAKVAARLAQEASLRQVIVFTHDITFFNELCRAADEVGIEAETVALFSDKSAAGKVDPAGMVWKGLNVKKRIGRIKDDAAKLPKLHTSSPADYEFFVKNLYGRLRDTYERVVEEVIFNNIVQRGVDVVQTQMLRYVRLSDELAVRFHEGMTRANTHSHDNPAADTVPVPTPPEFMEHIAELETLISDLKAESQAAEAARPQMKPKK